MKRTSGLVVLAALTLFVSLTPVASAAAPIKLGTQLAGLQTGGPAIAVDSTGTSYIAWPNATTANGADFVQYCVLPAGAHSCSHSGELATGTAAAVDGVQVLLENGSVVILANVFAGNSPLATEYEPLEEWQSTDGGAAFTAVNGGLSMANGLLAQAPATNGVVLPGADELGYGWYTISGPPSFTAFPLADPPMCTDPADPTPCPYATLEPSSNPDPIGNYFGALASRTGADPGVLGVYTTTFAAGPFACPGAGHDGTAYVYGSGLQSATNDYNVSPGSPGSAWRVAATQAQCGTTVEAVSGGSGGLGVLQDDDDTATAVYQPFDQASMKFDTPSHTVADTYVDAGSLSQDGAGGIFATYTLGGPAGPIALSYSADAGAAWVGPKTLDANGDKGADWLTSAVGATGRGLASWVDKGSVEALAFDAADTVAGAWAKLNPVALSTGTSVKATVACVYVPCTVSLTLTKAGQAADVSAARSPTTTPLGSGRSTIDKRGAHQLSIRLTTAGRKLIGADHGFLTATALESTRMQGLTVSTTRKLSIKPTRG